MFCQPHYIRVIQFQIFRICFNRLLCSEPYSHFFNSTGKDCAVSIKDIVVTKKNVLPLIVNNTQPPTFYYPDSKGILHVPFNTSITLACPGEANFLFNVSRMPWIADATCVGNTKFRIHNDVVSFEKLRCKFHPQNEAIKIGRCKWSVTRIAIGFDLLDRGFLKTLEVCFNQKTLRPVYSRYQLNSNIEGQQKGHSRPFWSGWKFYPRHNLNFLYRRDTQYKTFLDTLGSRELADQFFDYDNRFVFSDKRVYGNFKLLI